MKDGLRIIGAAFPRTGTTSVKRALEILGFGPSYHMHEVFQHPEHIPAWTAACDGHMPDWHAFLEGYAATLDTPACHFWRELTHAYPLAKVLLLQRDPEAWYESLYATAYQVIKSPAAKHDPALQLVQRLFFDKHMAGRFEDRDFAIATYIHYREAVVQATPSERLLVYEVTEGWEPLCQFLGCDVPDTPFPRKNTREDFQAHNQLG